MSDAEEIERLRKIIDACAGKLRLMLMFKQIQPRHEIDQLLSEMREAGPPENGGWLINKDV